MRYSLLLCLLLLGCDKKEQFETLAEQEQNGLKVQVLATAKTIEIADQLQLKMIATFAADKTVKSMDFVSGSYDVTIDDLVRFNSELITAETLQQVILCTLYSNKFGEVKLPDFKVTLKGGASVTIDSLSFNVKESEVPEEPYGIETSFKTEANHHWYFAIVLVVVFGSIFIIFRNGRKTKVEDINPLAEIIKSNQSESEKAAAVYNLLKKTNQAPEIAAQLEKAIFDKSTQVDVKKVLKELEELS